MVSAVPAMTTPLPAMWIRSGNPSAHPPQIGVHQTLVIRHTYGTQRATLNDMKLISWNPEKNTLLRTERGVSFEDVVFHIMAGDILDTFDHPNHERYPGQQIHVVAIEDDVYLVPFVESDDEVFLKTIIPSRKATKTYRGGKK